MSSSIGRSNGPDLSVVIMAYNEAASLEGVVEEIASECDRTVPSHELLIIDDGSTDGTGPLADHLATTRERLRVLHHSSNGGLGAVYRSGFKQASGRYITFFPADGQFPAELIPAFLAAMPAQDIVLGFLPGRRGSMVGRALSFAERLLYAMLFGPLPKFQGVLMFRRTLVEQLGPRSDGRGWAVLMELIIRAKRQGYRITSIPTAIRPRTVGQSKVNNLRTVKANLVQVVALRKLL
jgi:dolichol-phosphate mannosyltransferase